jgi:hypothetical protein
MPTMPAKASLLRTTVLAALLLLPGAAGAQTSQPSGAFVPRTVVTVPLQDLPAGDSLGDRAERLWSSIMDAFGFGLSTSNFMRRPPSTAHDQAREDFTWLMDVAGYKLKEIESSVSLFPSLSLTFGQARELTEGDRDYLERMLERHARANPGPLAAIQRTIVRGIMDAGEIGGFSVDKVEVDLFPLPKVKLVLTPTDAPLGIEASRIMRAIERLNQRVQGALPRTQGQGFEAPSPGLRGPALRPASLDH